jgi:hypothetical protein
MLKIFLGLHLPAGKSDLVPVMEDLARPLDKDEIERVVAGIEQEHDSGFQAGVFDFLANRMARTWMGNHLQLRSKPGLGGSEPPLERIK